MGDEAAATMDDVYVQGGTDGDKNFSGSSSLDCKIRYGRSELYEKVLNEV